MIALFFGANTLLEGKSVDDAKERISEAYVPTLIRNWCASPVRLAVHSADPPRAPRGVFIPTQVVNFRFVPPHLRFVTVSVVALFWSTSARPPDSTTRGC